VRRIVLFALLLAACKFDTGDFNDRACNEDSDCPRPDQACIAGLCTQRECSVASDCGSSEFDCNAGLCTARSCQTFAECGLGYDCTDGFCAPGCADHDGDGTPGGASCPGVPDCADDDPDRSPAFVEGPFGAASCADQTDNDCDGDVDFADADCKSKCANGIDDDGDGKADLDDPGCAGVTDDNERGTTVCDNGVDDDLDGRTDFRSDGNGDTACSSPTDTTELSGGDCNDGVDDDLDGKIDFRADGSGDPGCIDPMDSSERGTDACDNGLDDDTDTRTDFHINPALGDPGCMSPGDPDEHGANDCDDGLDNDMDGRKDVRPNGAGDPGCTDPGDLSEYEMTLPCDNGMDDDQDGKIDFRGDGSGDPGCDALDDISERGTAACDDGVDGDSDGRADYHMTAAMSDPGCSGPDDTNEKCTGVTCPLCDNGGDDDNDGKTDFSTLPGARDPGCTAPDDNGEKCTAGVGGCPQCDDGIDNEPDGTIDLADPGCADPNGNNEANSNPACSDGVDNDGDGKFDFNNGANSDPGCASLADPSERDPGLVCDDGVDNDNDGRTDFNTDANISDPGCADSTDANERCTSGTCPACDDGQDNDLDNLTDFTEAGADPGCTGPTDQSERGGGVCDDGDDNDGDGLADFRTSNGDPGCDDAFDGNENGANQCDDGLDNDNDGRFDFQTIAALSDPSCATVNGANERCAAGTPGCPQCDDATDNDTDGFSDFSLALAVKDPGCTGPDDVDEHQTGLVCDNDVDDDGDSKRDYKTDGSGETCCTSPTFGSERCACIRSIAAGGLHTCAVKITSTNVFCWGDNDSGQIGNDSTTDAGSPTLVVATTGTTTPFTNVAQVTAGGLHTCARKTDNTAWCWGENGSGQLGIGGSTDQSVPVQVSTAGGLGTVSDISAGTSHTCAIRANDGSVWCWGDNASGQLGDGTLVGSPTPVQVPGITALQLAAGGAFTCARTVEAGGGNKVKCWGEGTSGQLGNGTNNSSSSPVEVSGLGNVAQLAAGGRHACVRLNNNKSSCWGENLLGQLGSDTMFMNRNTPTSLASNFQVAELRLGASHSCALKADGTAFCWGDNSQGQIGNGLGPAAPNDKYTTPRQVSSISTGAGLAAGANHACVYTNLETSVCWGDNTEGQLGNGGRPTDRNAPVSNGLTCP